ncbi:MAG: ATP-binding protein [Rhodoferax sp.]
MRSLLAQFPVVALIGPRQAGKTTLARQLAEGESAHFFDLEDPRDAARLAAPMLTLEPLTGLVVLDEIQTQPQLFAALRVLADRVDKPARFLLLGSASPELAQHSAESLAGRVAYHELTGFNLAEVGPDKLRQLWLQGGFPRAYIDDPVSSAHWRHAFARTYLERDIPALGLRLPPATLRRFWGMLAHYHGQTWNGAELARAFGVSEKTVRHYLDILSATFMVRVLAPWHENLGKREVKAPKIYLTDSGLLHTLLGLDTEADLMGHPKVGASWEGFALQQVVAALGASARDCHYWKLHTGAELDLLVQHKGLRRGFEFKLTDSPRTTASMHSALKDLKLASIHVVHAGTHSYPMADRIHALALADLLSLQLPPAQTLATS